MRAAQAESAGGWTIAAAIIAGVAFLVVFSFAIICIASSRLFGEIACDDRSLCFRETGRCYRIPVDDILGVRHVISDRRRPEIDSAAPPSGVFFLGRESWIEVEVPKGRIRFFGLWETPKLAWLTQQLRELPALAGLVETESVRADDNGTILIANCPLALKRKTREKEAMARQYRVIAPSRPNDADQRPATIRWSTPPHVWREQVRRQRRADFASAVRVLTITSLIILATDHWFGAYIPPGPAWAGICWGIMVMAGIPFIAQALLPRHGPPTFAITDKGILRPSKEKPLISWTNLVSFLVEREGSFRRDRILRVCHREGYEIEFPLPPDEPGDEVIAAVASRLPQIPPPPSASPVRISDWLIAWILTGIFSTAMVCLIVSNPEFFDGNAVLMIWFGTMLAGPGTWVRLSLRRRRGKLPLMRLAIACNFVAGIALMIAMVVSFVAKLQTPTQPPLAQRHVSSLHR
jgi:hypothetical protein